MKHEDVASAPLLDASSKIEQDVNKAQKEPFTGPHRPGNMGEFPGGFRIPPPPKK